MVRTRQNAGADGRAPLSATQVRALRRAGRILTEALDEVCARVRPGATGNELDRVAEEAIRRAGGRPAFKGFQGTDGREYPATLCISPEGVVLHGVPTGRRLRSGDIVSLDLGVVFDGLYADAARTVLVGAPGRAAPEKKVLIAAVESAVAAALHVIRAGTSTDEVSRVIGRTLLAHDVSPVPEAGGHGIGLHLHEDPVIANAPGIVPPTILAARHAYAIEPIATTRPTLLRTDGRDGWTTRALPGIVSAHVERTVYLHPDGGVEVIAR